MSTIRPLALLVLSVALLFGCRETLRDDDGVPEVFGAVRVEVKIDGQPAAGISVTLGGRAEVTDETGVALFGSLVVGAYVVTIFSTPADVAFGTTMQTVIVASGNSASLVVFEGTRTGAVRGTITVDGVAAEGIEVTLQTLTSEAQPYGDPVVAETDGFGHYVGLVQAGPVRLTPHLPGVWFVPESVDGEVPLAGELILDFQGTRLAIVRGRVTAGATPLEDVLVVAERAGEVPPLVVGSNVEGYHGRTDADGRYFMFLEPDEYEVYVADAPPGENMMWVPDHVVVTVGGGESAEVDFDAVEIVVSPIVQLVVAAGASTFFHFDLQSGVATEIAQGLPQGSSAVTNTVAAFGTVFYSRVFGNTGPAEVVRTPISGGAATFISGTSGVMALDVCSRTGDLLLAIFEIGVLVHGGPLLAPDANTPRFGPDCELVTFERELGEGTSRAIFTVGADGSGATQRTFPGALTFDYHPVLLPGNIIVFNRETTTTCRLMELDMNTSQLRELLPYCLNYPDVAFENPLYIYGIAETSEGRRIVVVDRTDSTVQTLQFATSLTLIRVSVRREPPPLIP